jgi:hypothetical protein
LASIDLGTACAVRSRLARACASCASISARSASSVARASAWRRSTSAECGLQLRDVVTHLPDATENLRRIPLAVVGHALRLLELRHRGVGLSRRRHALVLSLAALHELPVRVELVHRLAMARLVGLDGLARAIELLGGAGALALERGETWRERGDLGLEVVDLEVVPLHCEERLDVRMHGARVRMK